MGRQQRIDAFAEWSKLQGHSTRDIDRKRVLRDLFELSADGPITEDAIEKLLKGYRQGLIGARAVLAARQVSDEILEWQREGGLTEEPEDVPAARAGKPVVEVESPRGVTPSTRPRPLSSLPPPPDSPGLRAASQRPRRMEDVSFDDEPPADDEAVREEPRPVKERLVESAPPRAAESTDWEALIARERVRAPLDLDKNSHRKPLGASRPPPKVDTGLDVLESDEGVSEDRRRRARLEGSPIDAAAGTVSTRPPPPDGDRQSSVRPGASERPPVDGRPPSIRPSGERTPSVRPLPASAVLPPVADAPSSRRWWLLGGGALLLLGALSIATKRPRLLYADDARPVVGTFRSSHLGVTFDLKGEWRHAEGQDDSSSIPEGKRVVSLFYRGTSHTDWQTLLTVVVFRGKQALDAEAARQLGANETMGTVTVRDCGPLKLGAIEGVRCGAIGNHFGRPVAVAEHYFAVSGVAVFFRIFVGVPLQTVATTPEDVARLQQEREQKFKELFELAESMVSTFRVNP
jgi:hypothetical protein